MFVDFSLLFVVGGWDQVFLSEVEVIDLRNPTGACSASVADYPFNIEYPTLAYIDGKVVACAGWNESGGTTACHEYDPEENEWTSTAPISVERDDPSSSLVGDDGEWLITGGGWSSSDVRTGEGVTLPGPELPFSMSYGCQLTFDDGDQVFLADGSTRETYVLDWNTQEFTEEVRKKSKQITIRTVQHTFLAIRNPC